MPVAEIIYQPNTGQLLAAYRPIRFVVKATATDGSPVPPFVSCDIYLDDLYYKSTVRTAYESTSPTISTYSFDITDSLQEYLQPDLAAIDNRNVLQAIHASAKVYCKFRASGLDANGFTIEEPNKPVQGTKFEAPVSGTGLLSNSFWAINSALQHEDNQNLASHLNNFKQGAWDENAFPLSHRKKYYFCPGDSDHYPVIFRGDCLTADLVLNYKLKGSAVFLKATAIDFNTCNQIDYTMNLAGNKLNISLAEALPAGQTVLVQFKKQAEAVWRDAGSFLTQNFFFYINGSNVAGDYIVRVIHFCTPCLYADPVAKTFTLGGGLINTEWKGINPYCVVQSLDPAVYMLLELPNIETETLYYPSVDQKYSATTTTMADLVVKFFSDPEMLNPYNLVLADLKIAVKKGTSTIVDAIKSVTENIQNYTIDANGTEAVMENVVTEVHYLQYSTYPAVSSQTDTFFTFSPYPTAAIAPVQTGKRAYHDLQLYRIGYGASQPKKPNDPGDDDYVAPVDSPECAQPLNFTTVIYNSGLNVSKVEFQTSAGFQYAPAVNDTQAGGYQYIVSLRSNERIKISVKASPVTALPGDSGKTQVSVTFVGITGALFTNDYLISNNVESALPFSFSNITKIKISKH